MLFLFLGSVSLSASKANHPQTHLVKHYLKKFSEQLAWETEVCIADMPDHMIHLNGDKFLGPR